MDALLALDLPVPHSDELNAPYWEAARHDEFLIPRCAECGTLGTAPIENCRHCLGVVFDWIPATGHGSVYSFIVYHRPWIESWRGHTPYIVSIVQLDEGPRILSSLVPDEQGQLPGTGDRVEVSFQERGEGSKVPVFQLAR